MKKKLLPYILLASSLFTLAACNNNDEKHDDPDPTPVVEKKFTLDSTPTPQGSYEEFLKGEARYAALVKKAPEQAAKLFKGSEENAKEKLAGLVELNK